MHQREGEGVVGKENTVWLSGSLVPWREATVPLLSHGFSRGSAIFEVFGIHEGRKGPVAFRMEDHLKRLERSAELMGFEIQYSTEEIRQAVSKVVSANRMGRGLIKILAYWKEEAITELVLDSKLDVAIFSIPDSKELGLDKAKNISACFSKGNGSILHVSSKGIIILSCNDSIKSPVSILGGVPI